MTKSIKQTIIVDVFIAMFFLLLVVEEITGLFEDELIWLVLIISFVLHVSASIKRIGNIFK